VSRFLSGVVCAAWLCLPTGLVAQQLFELPRGDAALPETSAAERESLRRIEAHLAFLASDALGGRETGTVHGQITAAYLAAQLHSFGLQPAGDDGSYLQAYPLVRTWLDIDNLLLEVVAPDGTRTSFKALDDYAVRDSGAQGCALEAEVVFAGHGLVHAESGLDEFAGLEVEGRFVLVFADSPSGASDPNLRSAANWRTKQAQARQHGALGLIVVNTPGSERAAQAFAFAKASMAERDAMSLGGQPKDSKAFPRLYVEPQVAGALFSAAGKDMAAELAARTDGVGPPGFLLEGVRVALHASVAQEDLTSWNVAGMVVGSDPVLKDEIVVLSAHMDHIGIDREGDVFNGADDNASGTTTVLMVAQALARDPAALKRSVLVLGVSGEEKGLLGSEWWVAHPTVELSSIVADINIDMVGRNDPHSIGITPSDEHPQYNNLVSRAVELGPAADLKVDWFAGEDAYRHRVDEYYYRSDHLNFAEAGIPVVFFFAGEHADYHKATDTIDKIDVAKVLRVCNLVTMLTRQVANDPERPVRINP